MDDKPEADDRARFVEIVEAARRHCGHPPERFDSDPASDLTLTLEVGGVWFEIGHAGAGGPLPSSRMGIRAILGVAPVEDAELLEHALQANLVSVRMGGGCFTLNPKTQEITYCFSEHLDVGFDGLMEGLARGAPQIETWQACWPQLAH